MSLLSKEHSYWNIEVLVGHCVWLLNTSHLWLHDKIDNSFTSVVTGFRAVSMLFERLWYYEYFIFVVVLKIDILFTQIAYWVFFKVEAKMTSHDGYG